MGKVFTITEGLENLGALRSGGQGSVYKGRRLGHIITAVKLLPTPIHTEDNDDKNFRDFQNEVEKLKKVNEVANPNVVKILNSGITESGSFPFIEMEFIEGPDLEDLLKAPHDSVFTIREVIKVAEQLSNALAHCHKVAVKHGDIKSNNIKLDTRSGNFILLDFGLSVMSDEQRRSSLRHAGAIEFMAPEQNDGKMLFQTDVYSFGVILYELLAGVVPFPLHDNGETARNTVMVSHMETPVPDVMEQRRKNLPESWPENKKESEMQVPGWLLGIVSKCLEKKPENRFKDGVELHEAVISYNTSDSPAGLDKSKEIAVLQAELTRLNEQVNTYRNTSASQFTQEGFNDKPEGGITIPKPVFFLLLLFLIGLAAFSAYSLLNTNTDREPVQTAPIDSIARTDSITVPQPHEDEAYQKKKARESEIRDSIIKSQIDSTMNATEEQPANSTEIDNNTDSAIAPSNISANPPSPKKYTLAISKAYLYNRPEESAKTNTFLVQWNNAELTTVEERNGFIYVVFFNTSGQITKAWLRKKDLKPIG